MKVVIQMVNVSKSFVYRRVRHQLWPILERWLTHDLHRYTTGTLTYKRRLLITRSIADIWIGIGALPADVHPVLSALSLISQQTTDIQLKNESIMLASIGFRPLRKHKEGAALQRQRITVKRNFDTIDLNVTTCTNTLTMAPVPDCTKLVEK
nr:MIP13872p [Haemonchus contortus]